MTPSKPRSRRCLIGAAVLYSVVTACATTANDPASTSVAVATEASPSPAGDRLLSLLPASSHAVVLVNLRQSFPTDEIVDLMVELTPLERSQIPHWFSQVTHLAVVFANSELTRWAVIADGPFDAKAISADLENLLQADAHDPQKPRLSILGRSTFVAGDRALVADVTKSWNGTAPRISSNGPLTAALDHVTTDAGLLFATQSLAVPELGEASGFSASAAFGADVALRAWAKIGTDETARVAQAVRTIKHMMSNATDDQLDAMKREVEKTSPAWAVKIAFDAFRDFKFEANDDELEFSWVLNQPVKDLLQLLVPYIKEEMGGR